MNLSQRRAIMALAAAGSLWGTTVPVTKLALHWLPPGWLTVARFGLAAAVLLVAARSRLRAACSPAVLAWGAAGYGGSILVQNAGVARTSVSHAALLVGATPVLVAILAALRYRSVARPVAWAGYAISLTGVGLVAAVGGGGSATAAGDGLVLASVLLSASFTVAQTGLLAGRDPVAVTAVQFLAATLAALPVAMVTEGVPSALVSPGGAPAIIELAMAGTLLPFTLFAYGQARVQAQTAATFLNLEPLVGAAAGVVFFGDPASLPQAAGAIAILAGIAVGSLPGRQPGTSQPGPIASATAAQQLGQPAPVDVAAGNDRDRRLGVGQLNGGPVGQGARALGHHLVLEGQLSHARAQTGFGYLDPAVDRAAQAIVHDRIIRSGGAVRDGGWHQRRRRALGERPQPQRVTAGLGADHLHRPPRRVQHRPDAGGEAAAADRHDQAPHLRHLVQQLGGQGAVASHHGRIRERMHEMLGHALPAPPGHPRQDLRPRPGQHLSAQRQDSVALGRRRGVEHHHLAGDARPPRHVGRRQGRVAGAHRHDPGSEIRIAQAPDSMQEPPHLKAARRLEVLQLQP
jgi:drug/metabolite transporter (DMT)-like permease